MLMVVVVWREAAGEKEEEDARQYNQTYVHLLNSCDATLLLLLSSLPPACCR
jgi:hypothetical protein